MGDTDDVLRRQDGIIDQHGWTVTAVVPTPTDPCTPFAYTVGLTAHGHPELVIAGLDPLIAQALLGDLAGRVMHHGVRFAHGQRITDLLAGYDAVIVDGPVTDALYPGTAIGRYAPTRSGSSRSSGPTRTAASPGTLATSTRRGSSR